MAKLFFSYCHADEALRNELQKHLEMLRRSGTIETWHDRMILAGDSFDGAIDQNIEDADVILLLVSSDFLASDYCYGVEVHRAMERHNDKTARVIPVILRPCDWHDAPFGEILATPTDGRPITVWPNQDQALLDVVQQIRNALPKQPTLAENPAAKIKTAIAPAEIRSSNLSLKKEFTEVDQDRFIDASFEYISKFFAGSLNELERRYDEIQTTFKRVDANCFTSRIYRNGTAVARCAICHGNSAFGSGITYSNDDTSRGNSINEMLGIHVGDQALSLTTAGMSAMRFGQKEKELTQQGAAEYFWSLLVQPLQ